MANQHKQINIVSAEPVHNGIVIHFSDETTILFHTHFLYEVRNQDGNVPLTDMTEEDLMKGFSD